MISVNVSGASIAFWSPTFDPSDAMRRTTRFGRPGPPDQPVVGANDAPTSKRPPDATATPGVYFEPAAPLTITSDDLRSVNRNPSKNQKENAAICLYVATQMGAPHKVLVAVIETIIVESGMLNLTGGDRDSVGLFQQRPTAGGGDSGTARKRPASSSGTR